MQQFYRALPNLNDFRGCCTLTHTHTRIRLYIGPGEVVKGPEGSIKTLNVRGAVNPHKKHYHHSHILWSLQNTKWSGRLDEI